MPHCMHQVWESERGHEEKKPLLIRGLDEKIAFRCTYTITANKHIPKFVKTLHLNVDCRIAANVVLE